MDINVAHINALVMYALDENNHSYNFYYLIQIKFINHIIY